MAERGDLPPARLPIGFPESLGLSGWQSSLTPHEIRQLNLVLHVELVKNMLLVFPNRLYGDAIAGGDFLERPARHQKLQNALFPRRKLPDHLGERPGKRASRRAGAVGDGLGDASEQFVSVDGLLQEVEHAHLEGAGATANVAVAGDDDRGQIRALGGNSFQDVQAVGAGPAQVENQATRRVLAVILEELAGKRKPAQRQPGRFQHRLDRLDRPGVFIDQEHGRRACHELHGPR